MRIITDTTSGLSPKVAERYGIPVIPQIINFGQDSYRECEEMDLSLFLERLQSADVLPQTAAPPPEWFVDPMRALAAGGETVLCIHPSAKVSGTVRSATVARQSVPEADVRVMDTLAIGGPLAWMVTKAAEWAEEGADADTVWQRLEDMTARLRIYFTVDTLEYLQRGGRIGGAKALLGNLLQIRPILNWVDGEVQPFANERTRRRAIGRMIEIALEEAPRDQDPLFSVMHAGVPDVAGKITEQLRDHFPAASVLVQDLVPAIVTHGGPGSVGLGYFVSGR